MADLHINNSEEVIEFANMLSSEGRINELKELLDKINNEINRFPLDERSEDNQLSLLKSKHEVEKGIEEQEKNSDPLAGSSLEEAVEYVEELEAIRRAEERIKWMYINAGKSQLWGKIRTEAIRRDKMKAKARADANSKAEHEDAFMKDLWLIFGILFGGIIVTGAILFVILA